LPSLNRHAPDSGLPRAERSVNAVLVISNLEYGGAQRQVVEIANQLPSRGITVHVCSLSSYVPLASHLHARHDQLHVIQKHSKFDISIVPRLAVFLRRLQADVVHGFLFDANIAVRLAGSLARTRLVIDSERNSNYHLKRRHLLAYSLTKRMRHLCVANSQAGAEFNRRLTRMHTDRYRVVYNGVDVHRFCPADRSQARQLLGLGEDEYVVGMFASFKPQKNHAMALRAFARLASSLPRARLLLVGDELADGLHGSNMYKRKMLELIQELGIRARCHLLGNRTDVESIYPMCDVVVLPSLHEGTPNVALEAMACAVPVVATDVADNAHLIPNGKAGQIVAVGSADGLAETLIRMADNPGHSARMGAFARSWVSTEFSQQKMAERIANIYREGREFENQISNRDCLP
jgi:glycosyltransferase involved in cell wall biosynthesis